MPSLSRITRELLAAYNLYPKKRLGQNFLVDPAVLARIINAAELTPEDTVLEIGMGLGVVTEALAKIVKKVVALEVDPDLILIAKEILKNFPNVEVLRKSVLEWDPPLDLNSFKIVGNLPYYITSPIIEKIIEQFPGRADRCVLTIQKEVAERIAARPGTKAYGSFTVFVQNNAEVELNSLISKYSFYPQPEVSSAIVVISPLKYPKFKIDHKLVKKAFLMRRKTLRNSLEEYGIDWNMAGIDPKRRAETLSLEEFEKLSSIR